MKNRSLKQNALIRAAELEKNRSSWEPHWKEIADFILPGKGRFFGQSGNDGTKKNANIVNGVATRALRLLAAGMQGGLTSPARPWFALSLLDSEMLEITGAREWLTRTTRALYDALSRSNFYCAAHTLYTELAAFGTGALLQEEDPERLMGFRVLTTGSYALGLAPDGRADSVYRVFSQTARTVKALYGNEASPETLRLAESAPDRMVDLCHIIFPREKRDTRREDDKNMPFASVIWEKNGPDDAVLLESGYREFPLHAPRWDVTAEDIYGRSPAMDALSDIKMLQEMARSEIKAVHKAVDPPMLVPASLKDRLSLLPGALNFTPGFGPGAENVRPLVLGSLDIGHTSAKIMDLSDQIRQAFYNDLFMLIAARPQMTATEVMERHEEKLLLLGPVIERQHYELLDPLVDRSLAILWRAGQIPPPPPKIAGAAMKVTYVSLLAQAQRMVGTQSVEATVRFAGALAGAMPEVMDRLDADSALKAYGEMVGAPGGILRSDEDVANLRMARMQMMMQQQTAAQAAAGQEGKKDAAEIRG